MPLLKKTKRPLLFLHANWCVEQLLLFTFVLADSHILKCLFSTVTCLFSQFQIFLGHREHVINVLICCSGLFPVCTEFFPVHLLLLARWFRRQQNLFDFVG